MVKMNQVPKYNMPLIKNKQVIATHEESAMNDETRTNVLKW